MKPALACVVACLSLCACSSVHPERTERIAFGKTVFIGDSITAFWDLGEYFPGQDFINMGVPSQNTTMIRARFDQDVLAFRPSTVVILAGTGDVLDTDADPNTDMTETLDNLRWMIQEAVSNGIRPVVCTVPPQAPNISNIAAGFGDKDFNPLIDRLDPLILELPGAAHCDYHAAMYDPTTDSVLPNITKDGVHPNPAGYAIMQRVVDGLMR